MRTPSVRLVPAGDGVWAAIRFTLTAAAAGIGFLALAALWMSTCTGGAGLDTAACGPVQNTVLDLGAPIILSGAAALAFWRGYAAPRGVLWHAAGAVLLILTAATLITA